MPRVISGCTIKAVYCTQDPEKVFKCTVTLNHDEIFIDFVEEALAPSEQDLLTRYHGWQIAPGHFRLVGSNQGDVATLHAFPNSHRLEGWWQENHASGMWIIELPEPLMATSGID